MAEKIYLDSTRVHIYPCANRGAGIDIESKLTTESNLINLPARLDPVSSTGLDFINHKLIFIIGGYYIEADLTGETDLQSNCWADYKLAVANLTMSKTGTETYVTKSNMLSNYETGSFELDTSDGKFKGIAFSKEKIVTEADTCVQLLENGTLVEQGLFGNITRKGGIAGDAAEPKTDDYLVFLDHKNNNKITKLSPAFDKNKSDMFLSQDGTFRKATLDKFEVALNASPNVQFTDRDTPITGPISLSLGESRILKCINNTDPLQEINFSRDGGVATLVNKVDERTHNVLAVLNAEQAGSINAIYKVWLSTTVTLAADAYAGVTYYSDSACTEPITSQYIEGYVGEAKYNKTVYIKMPNSYKTNVEGNIGVSISNISGDKYSCTLSLKDNTESTSKLGIYYTTYTVLFNTNNSNGVTWYSDQALTTALTSINVDRTSISKTPYYYSDAYCKVDGSSKPEDISLTLSGSVIDKSALAEGNNYKQYKLTIGGKGKIGNGSVTASATPRYKVTLNKTITPTEYATNAVWSTSSSGTPAITEYNISKGETKELYLYIPNAPGTSTHVYKASSSKTGDITITSPEKVNDKLYKVTITASSSISSAATLTATVKFERVTLSASVYPSGVATTPTLSISAGRAGIDSVIVKPGTANTGWKWGQWSITVDGTTKEAYSTNNPLEEFIPDTATSTVEYRADYRVKISAVASGDTGSTVSISGGDIIYETGSTTSGYVWNSANVRKSNIEVKATPASSAYEFKKWVITTSSGSTFESTNNPYLYEKDRSISGPLEFKAYFGAVSQYTVTLEENNRYYWSEDASTVRLSSITMRSGETKQIFVIAKNDDSKYLYINKPSSGINVTYSPEPGTSSTEVTISDVTANCTLKAYNTGDTEIELTTSTNAGYKWVCYDEPTIDLYHLYADGSSETWARIAKNTAVDLLHAGITASEGLTDVSLTPEGGYITVNLITVGETGSESIDLWSGKLLTFKSNEGYTWYKADGTTSLSSALIKTNDAFAAKIKNSSGTCNYISLAIDPDTALLAGITPGATSATVRLSNITADCVITPSTIPEYTVTLEENNRYYWVASSGSTQRISSITLHESDTKNIYVVSKNDDSEYLNINQSSSKINVIYTPEAGTSITEVKLSGCKANCILKPYDAGDIEITLNNTDAQYKWVSNDDATNSITHAYWSSATNTNIRVAKNESALDVSFAGIEETGGSTIDITQQIVNDYINVEITSASEEETNILNVYQGKKIWFDENNKYYFATDTAGVNICTERLVKYGGTTAVYAIAKSGTCSSISAGISGGSTKAKISAPVSSNKYTRAIISDVYEHCVVYAKNESDFCVTLSVSDEEKLQWLAEDFKRRQRLYLSSAETAVVYIEALSGYVGDVEFTTANCSITEGTTPLENLRKITVSNPTSDEARVTASV